MTAGSVLLATRSAGKLRELRPLFAAAGVAVTDLAEVGIRETKAEEAIECFETFEANALAKARFFFERSGGLATVADDSGLEVDALGGAPGVRSKRWSGRDDLTGRALDDANNALLMRAMRGTAGRGARYVCVAAYWDGSHEVAMRGIATGVIAEHPRGDGGFGYDPYFVSDDLGAAFAEIAAGEKERVSHRGRAFGGLLVELRERGLW